MMPPGARDGPRRTGPFTGPQEYWRPKATHLSNICTNHPNRRRK